MAQQIIRSSSMLKGSIDTETEAAESQLGRVVKPLNDAEVFQNLPEVYVLINVAPLLLQFPRKLFSFHFNALNLLASRLFWS